MTKQEIYAQFGPKLNGPLPGPKAKAAVAADERLISPSYTRSYPLVARRGRGVRIEDVDGNEFLDFASGIAVVSTGHCHPEVVAAIQKQARGTHPHLGHRLFTMSRSQTSLTGFRQSRPCPARISFSTETQAPKQLNAP